MPYSSWMSTGELKGLLKVIKYCLVRSDSSHDISNLYQLQDSTGILHRHSQICKNIFMDGQVGHILNNQAQ